MHIDYAAEVFKGKTQPKFGAPLAPVQVVAALAVQGEFLSLADALSDEKARSIVATIRKNAGNRYARVTPNQVSALAIALLGKYSTPAAVYAAAMGVTEADFMNHVEAAE